ncbi:NAD-dependent epimerase/dehydratase family protein [Chryseobacterium taiwanense]|uniref:NAD-dependent epimerase/dehydratase family protein n=1 Tax=Chryseobacterium taiwanense TaxID=363331 RepID=UPI000ABEBBB9|nr:NAD-dependent epimerase/dehydratase family protein [Chryseobacterium taiwanense]
MQVKETVLLLGGTGFIGRNIIDYVLKNKEYSNYKIVVLSRNFQREIDESIEYVTGDYADKSVLIRLFSKWNFTKVFHCATSTTPLTSGNNILSDINGNLIATIGLLDVMRDFSCKSILYLSSGGAVYGEKNLEKISENDICNPLSSYGVVKLTIENYLRLYQKQYGINYLILRISNPFGRFHTSEKQGVVNIAIRRALQGETLEVWGDGTQSKDYLFVDDLVKIIFLLLKQEVVNKILNVGSGESYQLNCILNTIRIYLPDVKVDYVESKTTDVKDFCLDISLMQSFVNFKFTELKEAIQQTIFWENSRKSILS